LLRRLGWLIGGAARMLTAPCTNLRTVENAVVIGVHLIEPGAGALPRPLLRTLQVLLASNAGGARRVWTGLRRWSGAFYSGGLGVRLGKCDRWQQRQGHKSGKQGLTHRAYLKLLLVHMYIKTRAIASNIERGLRDSHVMSAKKPAEKAAFAGKPAQRGSTVVGSTLRQPERGK
jgi:hypothetical protein